MKYQTKFLPLLVVLLLSTVSHASVLRAPPLVRKALTSTVVLEMWDENGSKFGRGSGFFVGRNLIATNFHVIDRAAQCSARIVNTRTEFEIEGVTAFDVTNDLALLKVTAYDVTPLPLGDSDTVDVGEPVYVAGNPEDSEGKISHGVISALFKLDEMNRLYMTAAFSGGNSGSPVLNCKGEVIGIAVGHSHAEIPFFNLQNRSIAIPSNVLLRLLSRSERAKPLSHIRHSVSAEIHVQRGKDKLNDLKYKDAIGDFTHAIRLNPNYALAYSNRGNAKQMLGLKADAIDDYDEAIRLNSNFALPFIFRGSCKLQLGLHTDAIDDFDKAIRINPNFGPFYLLRGIAKQKLGLNIDAINDYNETIRLNLNMDLIYFNRGFAKFKLGLNLIAIDDFDEAIRINPNHANAYFFRGLAKYYLGLYTAAVDDYDEAIRIKPDHAKAYDNRGDAKKSLGLHSAAIDDYDTALRLDPDDAEAYYDRGRAKREISRFLEAEQDFRTALNLAKQAEDQNLQNKIEEYLKQ